MFRCVVHRDSSPQLAALPAAEVIGEGFFAVDIQIVHNHVDRASSWVGGDNSFDRFCKLGRGSIRGGAGEVPSCLWFDHGEDIGRAATPILAVALGNVTWPSGARWW